MRKIHIVEGDQAPIRKGLNLVPLDISCPGANGLTVAEGIQSPIPIARPLTFLTARKKPGLRDKAKDLGAATFFQKPHEWEITAPKIHRVTRSQSQFDQHQSYEQNQ